jgi:hypothetical protein
MVALVVHQQPQTHLAQVVAVQAIAAMAVTLQVTQAVLAVTVEAVAEALTTLEPLVLVVTA